MRAARNQNTIRSVCSISGRGYWSGQTNTVTFMPAEPGTGIQFIRTDLPGRPRVQAVAENRISMALRTRLALGAAEVDMIEHVMAALYGAQIDNCEVHCTAAEMPGMDGSSFACSLALASAGIVAQSAERTTIKIEETIAVGDEKSFVRIEPLDSDIYEVEYQLNYGKQSPIGIATFCGPVNPAAFLVNLAPARTFISQAEAEQLQQKGLGTHVTDRDLLVFGESGPVNNQLRFDDECARHKALDLVGDLALIGADLVGRVIACRSGHQLNGELAALVRSRYLGSSTDVHQQSQALVGDSRDAA